MARDYRTERNALVERFYGAPPATMSGSRRGSSAISPQDGYGLPAPLNAPYPLYGHCLAWAYSLRDEGYGMTSVDGPPQRVHRLVYIQTRGSIPEDRPQINHLCDRPYCFQPSHLYAGTHRDNTDDRTIFNSAEVMNAWDIARTATWQDDRPLLDRMRATQRIEQVEPWHPVERAVQVSITPFACPGHDFAIPMEFSDARICRICGQTDSILQMLDQRAVNLLIAELWPISQASHEIFLQFSQSRITSPDLAETTHNAADRAFSISGKEAHSLRECPCHHCTTDRRVLDEATLPHLEPKLRKVIDLCNTIQPHIQQAIDAAGRASMKIAAQRHRLDAAKTALLVAHIHECRQQPQPRSNANVIEEALGAAAYCTAQQMDVHDPTVQSLTSKAILLCRMAQATPPETAVVEQAAAHAKAITDDLTEHWTSALPRHLPDLAGDPEDNAAFLSTGRIITYATIFEYIRHQATGISASRQTWPAPHHYCAAQIARTGQWAQHVPMSPFEEGKGYCADHDPLRDASAAKMRQFHRDEIKPTEGDAHP